MAPIGVAIIGSGIFVKEEHLPAVFKCADLSLKAIFSRSLSSAQKTAELVPEGQPKPQLYAADAGSGREYQDLLSQQDIQAVIIALPILTQPEYIKAALAAGKHVLAEKPIAADVAGARDLIDYYTKVAPEKNVTLSIAENVRFKPALSYANEQARQLGRATHFSIRVFSHMKTDSMWYNTEWRKTPGYQGGFLLDGGVHHAASSRLFLPGDANRPDSVRAFTDLVQSHLPPIDTVNALIQTKSGASGTFQQSAGTHLSAYEWRFAYEKGTVELVGDTVIVTPVNGEKITKEFARTSGVSEEVAAWAQSLIEGKQNPLQSPEEALADLEFMENMFRSGEEKGSEKVYKFQ
ncbi:unnamed protein product [Clonostachys rhizophaga]|uniref:Uncharacterized protein n=1 Tax=Clonostachys rhizophaga TaxID=160324 RepID=A0A9N9VS91_9HYPO|nr:unnamed protein product [Clonostachys rhizophaga]